MNLDFYKKSIRPRSQAIYQKKHKHRTCLMGVHILLGRLYYLIFNCILIILLTLKYNFSIFLCEILLSLIFLPFFATMILEITSGTLVPAAKIVSPETESGIDSV